MIDNEEVKGVTTAFVEADQDPSTNLQIARHQLERLVSALQAHKAKVRKLNEDSEIGKLDLTKAQEALDESEKLFARLTRAREMFELRIAALEASQAAAETGFSG